MAKGKSGKDTYSSRETTRVADIVTAAKSQAKGESYENGWPASGKNLHANQGRGGSRLKKG